MSSLAGRRVLVTRAAHQAGKLSEGLRALGAMPVEVPVLEIVPPESFEALDAALRALGQYDWLILTSANTVRVLEERAGRLEIELAHKSGPKVAAIGSATAAAAEKAGLKPDFVPDAYVAESLVAGLADLSRICRPETPGETDTPREPGTPREKSGCHSERTGPRALFSSGVVSEESASFLRPTADTRFREKPLGRVLLARAETARDVIPGALRAAGAEVDVVDAYRNVLPESAPALLKQALEQGIDAATFTSSSSVTHLAEAAQKAGICWPLPGVAAISIGPITSQTLRELGWLAAGQADPSDIPGLIAAAVRFFAHAGDR